MRVDSTELEPTGAAPPFSVHNNRTHAVKSSSILKHKNQTAPHNIPSFQQLVLLDLEKLLSSIF